MTHGNSGIQTDSNRHKPGKKQAEKQVKSTHLTLGLTHQMTHDSGRRKVAEMSVLAPITEDQAKISSPRICSLFHTFFKEGQKQWRIMAASAIVAFKLHFYYRTLKTCVR